VAEHSVNLVEGKPQCRVPFNASAAAFHAMKARPINAQTTTAALRASRKSEAIWAMTAVDEAVGSRASRPCPAHPLRAAAPAIPTLPHHNRREAYPGMLNDKERVVAKAEIGP
jgi:hypothetical protein